MATAVEPGSQPKTPTPPMSLPLASLLGAVYALAAIAVVLYAVPAFWNENLAASIGLVSRFLLVPVMLGVLGGLIAFGRKLLGDNPPKGIHGGIFLVLVAAAIIFWLWRWMAVAFSEGPGIVIGSVLALFLTYLAVRFFTGKTGEGWMVAVEEQGWFSTAFYKKSLGVRARRLTILGCWLLGGTGVWSLMFAGTLPENWTLELPFENMKEFTLLPDARYTIPLLLFAFTGWVGWRAVNVPTFAEFLIATEAEMNKVSWTPKKRLAQDTVVVLTTTLLLTLFLLVVDLFWGWLLSRGIVGVLPGKSTNQDKAGKAERAKW